MWILISAAVALLLLPVLIFVLALLAAQNDWHATFVKEGTIRFVVAGGDHLRTLVNVNGYVLTKSGLIKRSPDHPLPDHPDDPKAIRDEVDEPWFWITRYLRKRWGFYWVSFFYPWRRVHTFTISKDSLNPEPIKEGQALSDRILHKEGPVSELLFEFPRPLFIGGAEAKDRFRVDIIQKSIFQTVNPVIMVFNFRGKFYPELDSAIGGQVNDLIKEHPFTELTSMSKGRGSPYSKNMLAINNQGTSDRPEGIIAHFGVRCKASWAEELRLSPGQPDADTASRALEVENLKGDADVRKAALQLKAAQDRAKASAAEVSALGNAFGEKPEMANLVASVLTSRNYGQNSNISVLGVQATALVDGNQRIQRPQPSDPASTPPAEPTPPTTKK